MKRALAAAIDALPSAWPPLVALAIVVALALVSIVVDVVVLRQTAAHTTVLVDNALRSVELADDLREQARTLATTPLEPAVLAAVTDRIALDASSYEPLVTFEGEHDVWVQLREQLRELQRTPSPAVLARAERTIDRIVAINLDAARANVAAIEHSHRDGLAIDVIVAVLTFALALAVAYTLRRALRHQRELLVGALAAVGERERELATFAGQVAHDLRGPLTPLKGYADLLVLGGGPPTPEIGRRIAGATGHMIELIEALLALSVSGEVARGRVDLAAVVGDVLRELGPALDGAKVEVDVPSCTIGCTPAVLAQIVRNLVTNAIKYRAPDRRLELAVRATVTGDTIALAIADNGIGMDAETLARAFEPLYRAPSVRKIDGHGLGLAIVKRAVDALGGTCQLTSVPGDGSRVEIRLPVIPAAKPVDLAG